MQHNAKNTTDKFAIGAFVYLRPLVRIGIFNSALTKKKYYFCYESLLFSILKEYKKIEVSSATL